MEQFEMKTSVSLLSSALLLAITSSAFAASSVDLTVKGLITPSACTPSLPGDVDLGKIAAKDLYQDSYTPLEKKTLQLSVNCDAATLLQSIRRQSSRFRRVWRRLWPGLDQRKPEARPVSVDVHQPRH